MILWTIKLINNVRKAFAGRQHPSQLAWAVAFGFLLGVIPHGNLLAIAVLVLVLSLRLNHAMAALTAILTAIFAPRLDPVSDTIGQFLLNQPRFHDAAVNAWAMPLVPWTDLNNTVVLGSLLIGLVLLVPIFLATYPIFQLVQRLHVQDEQGQETATASRRRGDLSVDQPHGHVGKPHERTTTARPSDVRNVTSPAASTGQRIDAAHTASARTFDDQPAAASVETRIDVIRMAENDADAANDASAGTRTSKDEMDEALNFLLRQLRDSQQKDVA
ncbi:MULTISPECIES: TIGR03546 family protein [Crateriforma]|uniref:DUF2062 domain-containing protein n=1 Tax=Crateriforma conspicua TaxID=2527996 RepID=A0A5C6FUX4_9PLAN|nr:MULTISPECIES: TIGR03546 family protein [Crateriforma]TWU65375.1 hypothetical protein V7x_09220 [Crateriforma conspicua]